ncbi:hypothetical protein [Chamaesiphon minutus]|nr:hypothetical protein [Chamaesiphon minutus]
MSRLAKPSAMPTLALAEPAVGIASALADTRAAAPRKIVTLFTP